MRISSASGYAGYALASGMAALLARGAGAAVFACNESGILAAVAAGGGPHSFSCTGPTTVALTSPVSIGGSVILDGEDELGVSGGGSMQVFVLASSANVELRNLEVRDGVGGSGGCIRALGALKLVSCTVTGCSAAVEGGGVYSQGAEPLTIEDSGVSGNDAERGGGIAFFSNGILQLTDSVVSANQASESGGGIFVSAGDATITRSTLSGNTAPFGGAIHFDADIFTHRVIRSTISGNTATHPALGGGGLAIRSYAFELRNSTVAGNTNGGITYLGGLFDAHAGFSHSTLAGNSGAMPSAIFHPFASPGAEELLNTIVTGGCSPSLSLRSSLGGNVESPGDSCGLDQASDQVNVSAAALHLGALGDHGGPTQTVPLRLPSAALDAALCPPFPVPDYTDQRGVLRPQGAGCDSGAYEADFAVPALPWGGVASLLAALAATGALARRTRR